MRRDRSSTDVSPHPGTGAAGAARLARARRALARHAAALVALVGGRRSRGSAAGSTTSTSIVASMSPYDSAEAAAALSAELGRPWVADLRDPWALDEMMVYPERRCTGSWSAAHATAALASAAAIVMSDAGGCTPGPRGVPGARRPAGRLDPERLRRGRLRRAVAAPRSDDAFRIVHTGYLHTELGQRSARRAPCGGSWAASAAASTS